jgi:outer membrane protein OmpA-like peptidoglycan-associated protein
MKKSSTLIMILMMTIQFVMAQQDENLVQNGTFEQGNIGFKSDCRFESQWTNDYSREPGSYTFCRASNPLDPFSHSSLLIDVRDSWIHRLWYDSITIKPNTSYSFSCIVYNYWVGSVRLFNPGVMKLCVNGKKVSRVLNLPNTHEWRTLNGKFTSGPDQTRIEISINDDMISKWGNMVVIDNVVFREIKPGELEKKEERFPKLGDKGGVVDNMGNPIRVNPSFVKKEEPIAVITPPVKKKEPVIEIPPVKLKAQSTCGGSLGSPIFFENFGEQASCYSSTALTTGATNYNFKWIGAGSQRNPPDDGDYSIWCGSSAGTSWDLWHQTYYDHTTGTGSGTGSNMAIFNAAHAPGEFYRRAISGLCQNTNYTFSIYVANMANPANEASACNGLASIKPNLTFKIFNSGTTTLLASNNTGEIPLSSRFTWLYYDFSFTTGAGQTSVDVVLQNLAEGGCGNDLALDDISVRPCGPLLTISLSPGSNVKAGTSVTFNGTLGTGYTDPVYQWQSSTDGTTWADIVGATSINYTIPGTVLTDSKQYRLLTAENGNILNTNCRINSNVVNLAVTEILPVNLKVQSTCSGSLGSPIFFENFGKQTSCYSSTELSAGITNYKFKGIGPGSQRNPPEDGEYVIWCGSSAGTNWGLWHQNYYDHTTGTGSGAGSNMAIFNASFTPGEFYRKSVAGLCPNTNYTFSIYVANLSNLAGEASGHIKPNLTFKIFNSGTTTLLASSNTGEIPVSSGFTWLYYDFSFTAGAGQTSVDVVLQNLAQGGFGNDLALDDISVRLCGPLLKASVSPDNIVNVGTSVTFNGSLGPGYTNPDFQWQSSTDGTTWTDIAGATSINHTIPNAAVTDSKQYRLMAAENGNISNANCRIYSNVVSLTVNEIMPIIFFDNDKAELRQKSKEELDKLYSRLKSKPGFIIQVSGHTDDKASHEYNYVLSEARAVTVVQYLIEKGLDKNKLMAKGFGETKPVASNEDEAGRQQNRRVEFMILDPQDDTHRKHLSLQDSCKRTNVFTEGFEGGPGGANSGLGTGATSANTCCGISAGSYEICSSAQACRGAGLDTWKTAASTPHSGTYAMIVDGNGSTATTNVWCRSVTLTNNAIYDFTAYVGSPWAEEKSNDLIVSLKIDGVTIASLLVEEYMNSPAGSTPYQLLSGCNYKYTGATGPVNVCIVMTEQTVSGQGNDIMLDDIKLDEVSGTCPSISVSPGHEPYLCKGTSIQLDAELETQSTCSGSLGSPVFFENFGKQASCYSSTPLTTGATNYNFKGIGPGSQKNPPEDGEYVIWCGSSAGINFKLWHQTYYDHTTGTGSGTGSNMAIFNASFTPGEFYRKSVAGLCPNTNYTFSIYVANLSKLGNEVDACWYAGGVSIKPNLTFKIFNTGTTTLLASSNTGEIPLSSNFTWLYYDFSFTTGADQTSVDVVLQNLAPGGCGNDLALDDISVRPCGPSLTISLSPGSIVNVGTSVTFNGSLGPGYTNPDFQWQSSTDGTTWTDIAGATSINYTIPGTVATDSKQYRLLAAENRNLSNTNCRINSNAVTLTVTK